MIQRYFKKRLTPFKIALIYIYIAGLLALISDHFLAATIRTPLVLKRVEILSQWFFILLTACLLYGLIRHNERAIRRSQKFLGIVNRALRTRSGCHQVLVQAKNEEQLTREICRVVIEAGGYRLAWVGLAEMDEEKTVRPVAKWGKDDGYLGTDSVSWADNERGQGPTGTAIRNGAPSVVQHLKPWRLAALKRGYASCIALPLLEGGRAFGTLNIYAGEPDAFDPEEVSLLEEMAADLAYGITTLRMREERRRIEKERKLLATVLEQGQEGVLIFDVEGRVRYVNPAFESICGCLRGTIEGQNIRDLRDAGRNAAFYGAMLEALVSGEGRCERFTNRRKDGTTYEVTATISPVRNNAGELTAFAVSMRDITVEIRLESQLRQAQKMEAIATLAEGIAHDFNNILAAIVTCAEMAAEDLSGQPHAEKYLEVVLKAGQRGRDLVKQIRTLSRQNEQEKQPVRFEPIVGECLKLLRASLPSTIEIRQGIDENLGAVLADPTQIHQIIVNLCTNAAQAMREGGGLLEVSLDNRDLEGDEAASYPELSPGPYLRLRVRDTGHGMSEEVVEKIFDPFFTTRGQGEGTGLGLSVLHGIVKNHQGAIRVASEPGKGSTFQVLLPHIHAGGVESPDAADLSSCRGSERLLLVDDEEDLVFAGQHMLERLGYSVVATGDSRRALEIIRAGTEPIDLVITDQTMPHMTGERLAREMLSLRPDLPIILCTGAGPKGGGAVSLERMREIGIRELVMKPFSRVEMATVIRRLLDGEAARPKNRRSDAGNSRCR